jgi:hypothetical protein
MSEISLYIEGILKHLFIVVNPNPEVTFCSCLLNVTSGSGFAAEFAGCM